MTRPPIPAPPYEGGCLCGAVRTRLSAAPLALNACHCNDCKKLTGATNLLMIIAPSAAFSFSGAVQRYRKRADSGREIDIARCATCGTRMWHEPLANPEFIFLAAGTLDDPHWVLPTSHIWIERASPGVVLQDDALQHQGQTPSRQMLLDAFDRIYPRG